MFREGQVLKSGIGGVRLNEWDHTGNDPSLEERCQYDVSRMVASIQALRQHEEYKNCILSDDFTITPQVENARGKRVKFGILLPDRSAYCDDSYAAKKCHHHIVHAIHRSGFVVDEPQTFDAATGMAGLKAWAEALKLRRKRRWRPWLLLFPLFFLLYLFMPSCDADRLFSFSLRSSSFILIIDRSGSMSEVIDAVQQELDGFLDGLMSRSGFRRSFYGNIISYAGSAESALGGLERIDQNTSRRLKQYLVGLHAGGDTYLINAIEMAAREIAEHGKPTTLFIVTDAKDETIPRMLAELPRIKSLFQGIDIDVNSITPRIINSATESVAPINEEETALRDFTIAFEGTFGRIDQSK